MLQMRRYPVLLFIIICLMIRVFAGQTYVEAAIERVELYTKTCVAVDPECSFHHEKAVLDLGDSPSHELNLSLHLLGHLLGIGGSVLTMPELPKLFNPLLVHWSLVIRPVSIFHPPKN